jgi:hypothetical protein
MEEKLLSKEEIFGITEIVRLTPVLQNPNVFSYGNNRTSIFKVTPINGLIFIIGDSDTGFNHINERHSYWSEKHYWRKQYPDSLDTPSKFSRKSMPMYEYPQIADKLYDAANLNTKSNKHPDLFEMYSGKVIDSGGIEMVYNMLLYKETKIIHTMFPNKDKHNIPKIINYVKGSPEGNFNSGNNVFIMSMPFCDNANKIIYSFQVIKDYEKGIEKWVIVNHKVEQAVEINSMPIADGRIHFEEELKRFQFADLADIEKVIKQLDDDLKSKGS